MPTATINGLDHYYEDLGSGDPLVMLHGASSSSQSLAQHFPELSARYRIIAPDRRGMGRSAHVPDLPPSAWVNDVLGLLDHLSIDRAHIYGVSLGSRITLRFAIDHPERVRSLVLDMAVVANEGPGNDALNKRFTPEEMPEEQKRNYQRFHGDDWPDVVANYFKVRNNPDLQEHYNLRKLFQQVTVPVLITRGDRPDPITPIMHSLELHQGLPNSRLAIMPNQPPGLSNSVPETLRKLILDFLADVSS
jgi:pimeloyl-ACP methyl ester carboxylesterase